ncbi:unnamed protein product [Linum trigynum]|uniref:Uncharacterized protein n=1 Tax=Linum trigynum TaxID=586398 RepID=A0AAV2EJE3_9ROSI
MRHYRRTKMLFAVHHYHHRRSNGAGDDQIYLPTIRPRNRYSAKQLVSCNRNKMLPSMTRRSNNKHYMNYKLTYFWSY